MKNEINQARAKKGGQIGANGEFYKGGAFIATTDHQKRLPVKRVKIRKQQVENYVWVLPPEGFKSLFGVLGGVEDFENGKFVFNERLSKSYYGSPEQIEERRFRIAQFNEGKRWFKPFTKETR